MILDPDDDLQRFADSLERQGFRFEIYTDRTHGFLHVSIRLVNGGGNVVAGPIGVDLRGVRVGPWPPERTAAAANETKRQLVQEYREKIGCGVEYAY